MRKEKRENHTYSVLKLLQSYAGNAKGVDIDEFLYASWKKKD